ncbi:RagB/SusD family nutrient uptake outer membrane protein [Sphingobacterium psychroaquaticum]|uniref:RagB/SusD family nutrient uptake outer membrane protein n=1 Tax=Sphingobacterium psychroaquaticum TaxID=561061 RepID=UPI0010699FF4|nr:RagB/SusD family nutrient uptake outer membrane protein [Sphingobacterium psychroaquaticum]QBQ41669.1 RagB/SusD family nutrient uptake outer membrane protein [Sphingobacterium psychroaquaticum]
MKKSTLYITLLVTCALFTSCEKWLDVGNPKDAVETKVVFQDVSGLQAAIAGMYNAGNANSIGMLSLNNGMQADDLSATVAGYDPYKNNSLVSNDESVGTTWSDLYVGVYRSTAIIEGVPAAPFLETVKNQAMGEAFFIRALSYFYLVNLYGDVPLVLSTHIEETELAPRTAKETVYKQIVSDLEKAVELLPVEYPAKKRDRANKWAATALLARVKLYLGDYPEAERLASQVIDQSSTYILSENLNTVFGKNTSVDAIFAFDVSYAGYTTPGLNSVPTPGTVPSIIIHPTLLSLYEEKDARKAAWIGTSAGYPFMHKYKVRTGVGDEFDVVLRISEQYFIRAEARVYLNNLSGAAADVNKIRKRAKVDDIAMASKDQALASIADERRRELFGEWSHRWFDLKRTNKVSAVIGALKPEYWQDTDALYPIPRRERQMNFNLTQNEGYD